MDIEIRPCRDDAEMKGYGDVVSYVFAINDVDEIRREVKMVRPEWTMCAFDGADVVSSFATFPFNVRLNGAVVSMGGVTGVGTMPGYRRRGLLRKTMTAGLEAMEERGHAYAILWASMGAIYQRFGYGLAAPHISYTFDPKDVELLPGPAPLGRCSLVPLDGALNTIRPIYDAYAGPRNLLIDRPEFLWNQGPLRVRDKTRPYVAVYWNDTGEPRGYVVYTTREEDEFSLGPNQLLEVKDLAWLDLDAYRGLWEYLRSHDLVREVKLRGLVAEDDPMQGMLLEPRMLNKHTIDAIWMRIVNVERGLPQRPYGDAGELRIDVVDDLLPWNSGRWLFETDGKNTKVTRTDQEPDFSMPVATLATMVAGHRSASFCERAGRLEAARPEALRLADRIFATAYAPFTPNEF